jgi:hypothetical protein
MKKILYFLLLFTLFTHAKSYQEQWQQIKELERQYLPKSALEITNIIYQQAVSEANENELIKALLYREKYHIELQEDGYVNSIKNIENELTKAHKITTKLILKSLLAEMYANYLDNNRYRIEERTTIKDDNSSDILTWSIDRLVQTSSRLYLDSLQDEAKAIKIERYKTLLHKESNSEGLRPTLYDFLAFRALNYFRNQRYSLTQPKESFYIDQPEAFGNFDTFIEYKFKTKNKNSFKYQSLLIYQKLLQFHKEQKDTKALHHIDLERLQFVYQHFIGIKKDKLYLKTLKYLQSKYTNREALYYLALYYFQNKEYKQAIVYAKKGIKSSNSLLISRCQNIKNRIESQVLRLEVESVNLPHENILAKLNYKNIDKIYIKAFKLTVEEIEEFITLDREVQKDYIEKIATIKEFNLTLPSTDDYQEHGTEINLGSYGLGSYIFEITKDEKLKDKKFKDKKFKDKPLYSISTISNIAYLKRENSFAVVDRDSGEPLQGVEAKFYSSNYDHQTKKQIKKFISKRISDKDGFLEIPKNIKGYIVSFSQGKDKLEFNNHYYSKYRDKPQNKKYKEVHFFTDRAIYRPSQTIYFKGLAVEKQKYKKAKILANQKVEVTLYTTNHQKIKSQTFKTNEYGTFDGKFTAPKNGILGEMRIVSDINGAISIHVEEYKRPKFEIAFKPLTKSYRLGESVKLTGEAKSYSGYGLDGAKVRYHVYRRASFPWYSWWQPRPSSSDTQIAQGEIETNADGTFEIKFDAINDKSIDAEDKPKFQYEVSVDITDSTGESQSHQKSINIGYVAINATMNIAKELNINSQKELTLNTSNLDGEFQPLKGEITIEKVVSDNRVYRKRYWQKVDKPLYSKVEFEKLFKNYQYQEKKELSKKEVIATLSFDTQKSKTLTLANLEEGEYILTLHTKDRYGTKVTKSRKLTIYDTASSTPPSPTNLWSKTDKPSYKIGSTATLYFKSSNPNSFILLDIEQQEKIIVEKWIQLKDINRELINITKKSQGGLFYRMATIQNNRVIYKQGRIEVPWDSRLNIEFITFRDKLKPNSEEEWKIKISGENRDSLMAEMVTTMYDASLDKLYSSGFNKPQIYPNYRANRYNWWMAEHFDRQRSFGYWDKSSEILKRKFYSINWFGLHYKNNIVELINYDMVMPIVESMSIASPALMRREVKREMEVKDNSMGLFGEVALYSNSAPVDKNGNKVKKSKNIHIRNTLKETMFFKPKLQTDGEGNIIINFKTNDALTRWNFLAFAHTKELQMALVKKEIVTQKELMVVTNLPRFFREKDTIELSARVVNMSSRELNGSCELKLINPLNEQPIYPDQNFSKPFSVRKGASTVVKFTIKVPNVDTVPAIKHTIVARANSHSDAEQVIKPIFSNRMFVTESKSLFVQGNEEKSFTLKSLKENNSTTLKNHKLSLEFTSNPVWYAVRALPYLMEYPHECNEQLFSRYYANAIASKIANSSPKIKKIFQSWKSKKELISSLSSNQELKSVILEETPWLLNAKSEEEQQQNMGLLFDLVKLGEEQEETYDKLIKRQFQNQDGGWSWFDGGQSNWYITQYIVEGFGKLKKLGIDKTHTEAMGVATAFMDKKVLERYENLQKSVEQNLTKLEDDHLSSILIHYLYARSFYSFRMNKKIKEAHDYYLNQSKKYWTLKGLYEQGLIALTLQKQGSRKEAKAIVKSLKERALVHNELGMYFKYKNGFHWNEMPIETHALMIEVFDTITHDKASVEQLKIWLLKNKQTTHWKTTKATASAIYSLLHNGKWINNNKLVDIHFDSNISYQPIIEKAKALAQKGTGYFNASFAKFDSSMATVTIKNPNSNIAWGGLYWQYFEELDKIKIFKETPLTIDKKLFLIRNSGRGDELIPIEKLPLKVGDKIKVRIEIRVDRDMEYIMLKDARASAFEPLNVLSQYKWQDGLGYYESTKDNATYFFIDYLQRGTYVFEYPLVVTHKGEFSNGLTTIESIYAPEFRSHSTGGRILVK